MKLMTIERIDIKNFKGCRLLSVEPKGADISIYGDNATGKTTVSDAFFWLLFGKDSRGSAEFQIKTLDENGKPIHNLEHEVEAKFSLSSGDTLTLKKLYKEKWTKSRGSASAEFTGHTTDHWVNGVPVQEKEFRSKVAELCDEQRFRLLTDPAAFNLMHWQDRRKILIELCGDVSDEDVIVATPSLSDLPEILGGRSLDDHRKISAARRREINSQLQVLPAKISALRGSLPDALETVPDPQPLEERLSDLQEQKARVMAGGEVAEKTKRLREVEAQIIERENELRKSANSDAQDLEAALAAKRREYAEAQAEVERIEASIRSSEIALQGMEVRLTNLRAEGKELLAAQLEFTVEDTCAACGQPLPAERVAEARRKAEEEFNANKSRRLEANIAEGKAVKAEADGLQAKLNELRIALEGARARAEEIKREGVELRRQVETASASPTTEDEMHKGLCAVRTSLTEEIEVLKRGNTETIRKLEAEIAEVQGALRNIAEAKARIEIRNENLARIEGFEAEERELAEELEKIDREIFLCEEFVRAKSDLLTDRINARFKLVRFKLFEQQVNGGINEVCETTVDGVPMSSLNHGARLNAGLDIINTLSDHYSFAPPVFVDNAESVTSIIPTNGQQIKLIVSAEDKKLRIERIGSNETKLQSIGA